MRPHRGFPRIRHGLRKPVSHMLGQAKPPGGPAQERDLSHLEAGLGLIPQPKPRLRSSPAAGAGTESGHGPGPLRTAMPRMAGRARHGRTPRVRGRDGRNGPTEQEARPGAEITL